MGNAVAGIMQHQAPVYIEYQIGSFVALIFKNNGQAKVLKLTVSKPECIAFLNQFAFKYGV